jgi:hypothetical protein
VGGGTKRRAEPGSASPADEVVDLIASGRVTLLFADGDSVAAMCRTEDGVLDLGYDQGRGWWCSCNSPGCAHIRALRLFSESPGGGLAKRDGPALGLGPELRPAPEGPPRQERRPGTGPRSRWRAPAVGTAVLVVGAVAWLAWPGPEANTRGAAGTRSSSPVSAASPSAPAPSVPAASPSVPAPSPSPTPSPRPSEPAKAAPRGDVTVAFPLTVRRTPLFVSVVKFRRGTSSCVENLLDGAGAYLTDCPWWWWPGAPPVALFHVTLLNKGDRPLVVSRRDLRLVGAGGMAHRALEMSSWAALPETFLPASMHLDPDQQAAGWVAFDWSSPFVPRRLELPRKGYTIAIRFVGTSTVGGGA